MTEFEFTYLCEYVFPIIDDITITSGKIPPRLVVSPYESGMYTLTTRVQSDDVFNICVSPVTLRFIIKCE